ncbi:MAG TPA: CNNM domain-containing protein [Verrucomicrobiota bacterium]|nr:CNNM domain-containing protein [Verrucomicrobiota bacterium]HQL78490.1 CNNM domain-containing protein [Verrucomicrobiota bacterium]
METNSIIWAAFGACLALSFVLSGMEAGVFALSRLRIRRQMRAGKASAKVLHDYLENPENFLWTILVGSTLVNFFVLGWLVVRLHSALSGQRLWFVLVFSVAVFLFYTFFDLLPKMLFRTYPNRLCVALARPFRLVHLALRPLVALVEAFSGALLRWRGGKVFTGRLFGNREELRLLMQESAQGLTSEERTMINRVLDLQALTVRQVMRPLEEVVGVSAATPVSAVLALCRERKLARLPVWEERDGGRRIIGMLGLGTLLYQRAVDETRPIGDYVRPALFLDENLRLEVALGRLQRSGQRLAIVLNRERREIGILSLQDVLKVIFGEVSL